ncbi:putative ascorbate peroxidase [Watersipora subatra]|uniref:putative ascorbate peroxidase n=1 Tax=Watersipora subatra TaxID=2589382 RepID=UPI00355C9652
MKSKVIITAVVAFTALLDFYAAALNYPIDCNTRGTTGQSYRLPGETTEQGRQRRKEERCYCRPTLAQCQPGFQRPETSISSIKTSLKNFIEESFSARLPAAVRLVFHSCVGSTGCDGCINADEANNAGLMPIYYDTINLWTSLGKPISFADFVVLLGTVAVETGMAQTGGPGEIKFPFRTGRRSCSDPATYNLAHTFPQGQDPKGIEFLMEEFGLTKKLAVALLGAHSLGRCRAETSGFEGTWDRTPTVMDNGYYLSLVNTDWDLRNASNGFTQWSKDTRMMLHTDMAIIRDLQITSGQVPRCGTSNGCPITTAHSSSVVKYTGSQQDWAEDFKTAFLKMVEHYML